MGATTGSTLDAGRTGIHGDIGMVLTSALTDAFQKPPPVTSHSLPGHTCPGSQSCAGCWEKAAGGRDYKAVIFFVVVQIFKRSLLSRGEEE